MSGFQDPKGSKKLDSLLDIKGIALAAFGTAGCSLAQYTHVPSINDQV
jgi:hypothetical protein